MKPPRMCGRARTGMYMETIDVQPGVIPYELEIALVDDLKPGDVPVLATGGSRRIALCIMEGGENAFRMRREKYGF